MNNQALEKVAQHYYSLGRSAALGTSAREKTAFLTRMLMPISKNLYKGDALVSRIAPMGGRRILSEIGHGLGDMATGEALAQLGGYLGNVHHMPLGIGSLAGVSLGSMFNGSRANKYLDLALQAGENQLSKKQLKTLLNRMGGSDVYFGSSNAAELIDNLSARDRVQQAINSRLF